MMAEKEMPKILRISQVTSLLNVSTSTFWRMRQDENFPKPILLSERIVAWRQDDIEKWLAKFKNPEI